MKRIMEEFEITEISGVDRPAQAHAKMTIMKRHDEADSKVGDEDIGKKEKDQMADEEKKVTDLEKQVTDLTAKLEKMTDDQKDLTFKASMSDIQKTYYEGLDEEAKKGFVVLPEKEREKAAIEARKVKEANDEVIKTADNVEIRKSVVGDAMFAIIKSQETRIAKQNEDLAKAQEASALAEFTKRAETELKHLPGELAAKAQILKAISGISKETQESLTAMLKAGDSAIKAAFKTNGHGSGVDPIDGSALSTVNKKVAELRKADPKMTEAQAMTKIYSENPELYEQLASEN
jgi:hypothetical protein